ncbi:MAG: hypothetical protein M1816_002291 [Peltula sp. TS41687]|nr:MAG: hypothetical protein M1816_002291 [Peltula sp. TS41687]
MKLSPAQQRREKSMSPRIPDPSEGLIPSRDQLLQWLAHRSQVVACSVGYQKTALVVMSNGRRFYIAVSLEDLRQGDKESDTGVFSRQYLRLVNNYTRPEPGINRHNLLSWVLAPCLPHFARAGSLSRVPNAHTLYDHFVIPTVVLRVKESGGRLVAWDSLDVPVVKSSLTLSVPSHRLSPATNLRCYLPSQLVILPSPPGPVTPSLRNFPRCVRPHGTTSTFFLSLVDAPAFFVRELDVLIRIERSGLEGSLRVPRIRGLVRSNRGSSIIGSLTEYIAHDAGTFQHRAKSVDVALRGRWMRDIRYALNQLHKIGVVWGDVRPDNILVDLAGNAWVVDFRGRRNRWVDADKAMTREGDLQGLARMEDWIARGADWYECVDVGGERVLGGMAP